jgi:hypothetical protein
VIAVPASFLVFPKFSSNAFDELALTFVSRMKPLDVNRLIKAKNVAS